MSEEWKGLTLPELVDLLEPIPDPAPISMMPQAPGWYVVGAILLLVLVAAVVRFIRRRKRNAYRRAALADLETLSHDDVAGLALIIRRTALSVYPRDRLASLHGHSWLEFLDRSYQGTGFTREPGNLLASAPYRGKAAAPGELKDLVRTWIKKHRGAE